MTKTLRCLDYFFVLRPTLHFPIWAVLLAGYYASKKFAPTTTVSHHTGLGTVLSVILLSMLMGAVFIFNQIVDRDTDSKNQKLFFLADGIISVKTAIIEGVLLTVISLGFAFYLDKNFGLVYLFIFFITGIVYSFKPFSWKDKPILGIVANFTGGWAGAVAGWIAAGSFGWQMIYYAIPYGVGLVALFLLTTIPDIPGDKEVNKITFGVRYGQAYTTYWALAIEVLTVIVAFVLKDYVIFFPALASFPFFLMAAIKQGLVDIVRAIKLSIIFTSLAVSLIFPIYFVIVLLYFYFAKWYYRKRFNLEYPKFAA